MPGFFLILEILLKCAFWYCQQLLFRFFFYILFIHRCLQFWEKEKLSGSQVRWIRWLRHDYGFVFGQKLTHKHRCVSWSVINDWFFHNSVRFWRIVDSTIIHIHFLYCFNVFIGCWRARAIRTSSWSSLNRLYHTWTCVLLVVGYPNATTANISNVFAHLISFLTKNLIQFLWSIISNSKKSKCTPKQDLPFYLSKTKW